MSKLRVYSSAPASTQLAVAFLGLQCLGVAVEVRPLAEFPTSPVPRPRRAALQAESTRIGYDLRAIAERLDEHVGCVRRLEPGEHQELLATRDGLAARRRQIEHQLREGGRADG